MSSSRTATRRSGGRIHPHQRDTDDQAPVLGSGILMPDNYQEQYNETVQLSMDNKALRDYRCRIKRICDSFA